jgi:peptidoglycan/LPS O-acetylase OafA/YrhL
MFKEMIFFQSAGFFGSGAMADLLSKWEQMGFFSYLLPFLLIFALVFGILTKTNIFKDNKTVNGIIALAVALMALQFNFVSEFFSQVFPRVGVGLAVILIIMIIAGLFAPQDSNVVNYILLGVGVLIVGFILIQSAGQLGWQVGQFWDKYAGVIIAIILIVVVVIALINSKSGDKEPVPFIGPWAKQ